MEPCKPLKTCHFHTFHTFHTKNDVYTGVCVRACAGVCARTRGAMLKTGVEGVEVWKPLDSIGL